MADNLARLSIPSRLLEDSSGLKATPRRGLAQVRGTGGQSTTDKKPTLAFGGQTQTPTCLPGSLSTKRKTSSTLTIYEDPALTEPVSQMGEKEPISESEEEVDTCDRDPTRDEETPLDWMDEGDGTVLFEGREIGQYKVSTTVDDDDAKTLIFCMEEDNLSIYSISSESACSEYEEMEEEGEDDSGVGQYFHSPYGVATNFEELYSSLEVEAHESDTEIDYVSRCSPHSTPSRLSDQ